MIVRQFLQWVRTAEAAERAEATSALARAYLYSDLSDDDRAAAEGAMILLLGDPRVAAFVDRPSGRDPPRPGGQALRDARGLHRRAQLDGRGQGAAHRAGGLRKGDGYSRG